MKRKLFCLFTIVVIIAVGSLSGCGGCGCQEEHEVYNFPESEHDEPGGSTYDDFSDVMPSEAELGAPVYSENLDPSSISSSQDESNGEVVHVGVDFSTSDDFQTVFNWYKSELGEPKQLTQTPTGNNQATWEFEKDGRSILVVVTCTGEGAAISILNDKI
jgi:hypothetical protein